MTTTGGSPSGNNPTKRERAITPLNNLSASLGAGTPPRLASVTPKAHDGSGSSGNTITSIRPTAATTSPYVGTTLVAQSLNPGSGDIKTTVQQKPGENAPVVPVPADGAETTNVDSPRSDSSVVLAGQIGTKKNRSPARSNNFVSLASGDGSLGRKTGNSKRSLIGGA